MSYLIPSKLWQRVSIFILLLLIPSLGIAVFRQYLKQQRSIKRS